MGRSMHPDLGVAHVRFIPVQLFVLNVRFSILKPTVLQGWQGALFPFRREKGRENFFSLHEGKGREKGNFN